MNQKVAFIFPGQGSQYVGMAQDLYETFPSAKEKFTLASDILEFDLADVCFNGPEEKLKQTKVTQPAVFVHSCIVLDLIAQRGIKPQMVAGHSLGEYSALVAAGVLDFENALKVVKVRGAAMQTAGEERSGTMAAIIGLEASAVDEVCEQASSSGIVQTANYNSPGQIVISGEHKVVREAMQIALEKGARKAIELVVGSAFHSPLMESARQKLKSALDEIDFRDAKVPVYQNVSALPEIDANMIKSNLDKQLTSPVRWIKCTENMVANGVTSFYELGPNKVLSGLVRRIDRTTTQSALGKAADFERTNV